jgi:hypothetical protein
MLACVWARFPVIRVRSNAFWRSFY